MPRYPYAHALHAGYVDVHQVVPGFLAGMSSGGVDVAAATAVLLRPNIERRERRRVEHGYRVRLGLVDDGWRGQGRRSRPWQPVTSCSPAASVNDATGRRSPSAGGRWSKASQALTGHHSRSSRFMSVADQLGGRSATSKASRRSCFLHGTEVHCFLHGTEVHCFFHDTEVRPLLLPQHGGPLLLP
jgi:hypothetical protein